MPWLPAPDLSADGVLRGAGVRGDGVAQVVFADGALERAAQRPLDAGWQPPAASGLPAGLTTVVQNAEGDRIGWARTDAGALVVSSRGTASRRDHGAWSSPLTLATGVTSAAVALNGYREGVAAWTTGDGAVWAALRGRFGAWGAPARLQAPGATAGPVALTLGESGDAVVAWTRGAPGARVVRASARQASVRRADNPFAPARTVRGTRGDPRVADVAVSLAGDATLVWIRGDADADPGRLLASDHRSGASVWRGAVAVSPIRATGARVGVAAGGGAVVAWQAAGGGVQVARRAAGGGGRWVRTAPPPSAGRLIDLVVTRLGEAAVMAAGPGEALTVARRPVGSPRWLPASPGGPAADGLLRADGAGDLVAAWRAPGGAVRAASYTAAPLPRIARLTATPAVLRPGATTTLRFRLSAPGRVIVSLRRPFGARALAALPVAGRRGANAVRVPRGAVARLLGPGRYVVVADTSARRLGESTTVVRTD
ncbi:MAG: hypothetical protein AB7G65_04200 [Thermoleophilia bacterium]